jgi:hypothetical protein
MRFFIYLPEKFVKELIHTLNDWEKNYELGLGETAAETKG